MIEDIKLMTGADIPFPQSAITIHQPKIKEIGIIGERNFFTGCEILTISKDNLESQDKIELESKSDFEILLSVLNNKSPETTSSRIAAQMVLALIFPQYQIKIDGTGIGFKLLEQEDFNYFNKESFMDFKTIIIQMFCLKEILGISYNDYNPAGSHSSKIAEKLRQGKAKVSKAKSVQKKQQRIDVFGRYMSILAVGERKDLNKLSEYTVYQLSDEFKRYQLEMQNDIYLRAKLAGAKDMKEVENWMKDIHEDEFS